MEDNRDHEHEHDWGPIEYSRFSGNPHRACQIEGCRFITLDLDDENESWDEDEQPVLDANPWVLDDWFSEYDL